MKKGTIRHPRGHVLELPVLGLDPEDRVRGPGPTRRSFLPQQHDGTGVVILVSKSDVAPSKGGTLNEICTQAPTDLVQCYAGTGTAGYDGAATGQGLSFIHSFTPTSARHSRHTRSSRDVKLAGMVCTGPAPEQGTSRARTTSTTTTTARSASPRRSTSARRAHRRTAMSQKKPNQGGFCAEAHLERGSQLDEHEREDLDVGREPVGSGRRRPAGAHAQLDRTKTSGTNCSSPPNSGTFGTAAMSYATDDNSGPVGYVKLTASGPNVTTGCPAGGTAPVCELGPARQLLLLGRTSAWTSRSRLKHWDTPQHRPALREQVHPQGRQRDCQPQRVAPLRLGQDVDGLVHDRLLHDLRTELRRVGPFDHAAVRARALRAGRTSSAPRIRPAACRRPATSTTRRRSASRPRTARCRPSRRASTTASRIPQTATAGARPTTGRRIRCWRRTSSRIPLKAATTSRTTRGTSP